MRVMTYNVRGFRDGLERLATAVRQLAPDVLLLQETGSRGALRRFARHVDMRVAHDPWSPFRRRVKNAVLLADPWSFTSIELVRFPAAPRWYPRGALVTRATSGHNTVLAVSTHFGLGGAERATQAVALQGAATDADGAGVIVGGDLNATPDTRAVRRLADAFHDAWTAAGRGDGPTFPAVAPSARIDYVFVGEGIRVLDARVGTNASNASDHLPVVIDLRLADT